MLLLLLSMLLLQRLELLQVLQMQCQGSCIGWGQLRRGSGHSGQGPVTWRAPATAVVVRDVVAVWVVQAVTLSIPRPLVGKHGGDGERARVGRSEKVVHVNSRTRSQTICCGVQMRVAFLCEMPARRRSFSASHGVGCFSRCFPNTSLTLSLPACRCATRVVRGLLVVRRRRRAMLLLAGEKGRREPFFGRSWIGWASFRNALGWSFRDGTSEAISMNDECKNN